MQLFMWTHVSATNQYTRVHLDFSTDGPQRALSVHFRRPFGRCPAECHYQFLMIRNIHFLNKDTRSCNVCQVVYAAVTSTNPDSLLPPKRIHSWKAFPPLCLLDASVWGCMFHAGWCDLHIFILNICFSRIHSKECVHISQIENRCAWPSNIHASECVLVHALVIGLALLSLGAPWCEKKNLPLHPPPLPLHSIHHTPPLPQVPECTWVSVQRLCVCLRVCLVMVWCGLLSPDAQCV